MMWTQNLPANQDEFFRHVCMIAAMTAVMVFVLIDILLAIARWAIIDPLDNWRRTARLNAEQKRQAAATLQSLRAIETR